MWTCRHYHLTTTLVCYWRTKTAPRKHRNDEVEETAHAGAPYNTRKARRRHLRPYHCRRLILLLVRKQKELRDHRRQLCQIHLPSPTLQSYWQMSTQSQKTIERSGNLENGTTVRVA